MSEPELYSEVLQRALAIQEEAAGLPAEHADLVRAAEEAGIQRDAVLQALRERVTQANHAFREGELVFAKSADDHFYVAELLGLEGERASVRYLTGGNAVVPVRDVRLFSLTPGLKLGVFSASMNMWSSGRVTGYDHAGRVVHIDNYGTKDSLPVTKVRLYPERSPSELAARAQLWWIAGGAFLGGSALGMAIMKFISR